MTGFCSTCGGQECICCSACETLPCVCPVPSEPAPQPDVTERLEQIRAMMRRFSQDRMVTVGGGGMTAPQTYLADAGLELLEQLDRATERADQAEAWAARWKRSAARLRRGKLNERQLAGMFAKKIQRDDARGAEILAAAREMAEAIEDAVRENDTYGLAATVNRWRALAGEGEDKA